ncbi:zinc finger protein [Trichonephila clavipes]|nr:zinc finger protein [Trichonephila clavipes]
MRISHKRLTIWKTTFTVLFPIYGHKCWKKSSKIGRPDWTTSEPAVAVICQKSYLKSTSVFKPWKVLGEEFRIAIVLSGASNACSTGVRYRGLTGQSILDEYSLFSEINCLDVFHMASRSHPLENRAKGKHGAPKPHLCIPQHTAVTMPLPKT